MQPLGYTDSMSNLGGMEKEFADAMPEGYLDSMKMWMSSDLKSAVTLVNGKAMAESAGMANAPTGADGFALTVIQMK